MSHDAGTNKDHTRSRMFLAFLALIGTDLSKTLWTLPLQLLDQEAFKAWVWVGGGSYSAWLMLTWFYWGSYVSTDLLLKANRPLMGSHFTRNLLLIPLMPVLNEQTRRFLLLGDRSGMDDL